MDLLEIFIRVVAFLSSLPTGGLAICAWRNLDSPDHKFALFSLAVCLFFSLLTAIMWLIAFGSWS